MAQKNNIAEYNQTVSLNVVKPYDFALSLQVVKSFQRDASGQGNQLHLATRIDGTPALIEVSQSPEQKDKLKASSTPATDKSRLRTIAEWVLFAELNLTPFYRLTAGDPKLEIITRELHGLKPMRPASLFEMAVIAITEQQISLAAAYKIRSRIVQRFGEPVNGQWVFPEPDIMAGASLEELRLCGLSRQKAHYIQELASRIANGTLDLNSLKSMDDEKARETIMNFKGFGRWSADYFLVRGLARPDCVPIDDLAIRSVVGEYLGDGQRVTPQQVIEKLEPFRPYRGLLAFYFLAKHRLNPVAAGQ